jgi:hypothetical protein
VISVTAEAVTDQPAARFRRGRQLLLVRREVCMSQRTSDRYVAWIIGLAGVFHAGSGVWAFAAPRSFYHTVATFPPFNAHFLADIGAFLTGIGVVLLASLVWSDARFVVLLGGTVAAVFHWISHVRDHEVGGTGRDPWLLGLLAVLLLAGLVLRWSARDGAGAQREVAAR